MEGFNEFLTHCENLGMRISLYGLVTFIYFIVDSERLFIFCADEFIAGINKST